MILIYQMDKVVFTFLNCWCCILIYQMDKVVFTFLNCWCCKAPAPVEKLYFSNIFPIYDPTPWKKKRKNKKVQIFYSFKRERYINEITLPKCSDPWKQKDCSDNKLSMNLDSRENTIHKVNIFQIINHVISSLL
jgi:hypothetical protein